MIELLNMGISENTIKSMLELEPSLTELKKEEIIDKKIILEKIGCSNNQIINITSSNPSYLDRTNGEIIKLINCLNSYKFNNLNILFDSNPYILSLEPFEINNYVNNKLNNGERLEDIVDELDSNPYLFNEM